MKMNKVHIVLAVVLLGNAVAMQGMMQQGRKVFKKPIYRPVNQRVNKPTTQTWGNWFKSFFHPQAVKPVENYAAEEVYSSPFEKGGQKRMYSTYQSSTTESFAIPGSFEPSWKSKLPWTDEYKIEELFKELNDDLDGRINASGLRSAGRMPDAYQFQKMYDLIKVSGYNPLNRFIQGQPSFSAKMLKFVFRYGRVDISNYGKILDMSHAMGARIRKEEENEIGILVSHFLQSIGINRISSIDAKWRLSEIIAFARPILAAYNILRSIEIHINTPFINWDKLDELCDLQLDPEKLKKTIEDLQKNPKELLNSHYGMIRIVMMTKYGRSDRPITGEYVINLLKQAGFSGIGARRQEYHEQQYGSSQFGTESFGTARNKLAQLLGIAASSSEKEISNAYRKFVMQYHPDITKNPNNPMSLKLKNEINPAWDEYNKALNAVKQEKGGRE